MLSERQINEYRKMALGDKLRLTLDMCRESTTYLLHGTPEQVRRKFELLRRENDLRNENMLKAIARTRWGDHGDD